MRILHVTDCFLPQLGGIEMHVHDLANRQRADGDDAEVVTTAAASAHADDPPWVARLGQVRDGSAPRLTRALDQFGTKLLTDPVDVVHVHVSVLSPFATGAARSAGRLGIPTLVTVHSLWSRLGPLPTMARALLRLRYWPVTWSAVSDRAAEPLRTMLGPSIPVHVLPNAVDLEDWRAGQPQLVVATPSPPTIVSVMRLTGRKRPLPLVRMLRRVRAAVPADQTLHAVIIGDGPQRAAVKRYLRRHGMDDWVQLTGALERAEIRRQLESAAVYVAPAELESFGIAALEARAVGLPVVASSRGGVGEFIVDGLEGVMAADDDAMVSALVRLVADARTRSAMAAHNTVVPPMLDWSTVCRLNADLYEHTIAQRDRDGHPVPVGGAP